MSISHYSNKYEKTEWGIHTNSPTAYLNITNDATIAGTIQVDTVANDDTENRLIVWDTTANVFEYRNVSSLPVVNPFDQDLNTFDPVEFLSVDIDGGDFVLSSFSDSNTRFWQSPASTFNDKIFNFRSDTDSGAVVLEVLNNGQKSAGLTLQTQQTWDGNAFIRWEPGNNVWFSGVNKGSNTYRIHYSPGNLFDNLYDTPNERLVLTTGGDLTLRGDITIDDGNTTISSNDDSTTTITQTPASTVSGKVLNFVSDSDAQVQFSIQNNGATATSHSMINLQTDVAGASNAGGNQLIYYDTAGTGGWQVGRQKSTDTFRWNNSFGAADFLTNDAYTKMYLDVGGNLYTKGWITLNDNLEIFGANDSTSEFNQTPAVQTGKKDFVFNTNTADTGAFITLENENVGINGHSVLNLKTDAGFATGNGGNQIIHYENAGGNGYSVGHNRTDNTFKWNSSATFDDLTTNTNMRMVLNSSGDLGIDGELRIGNVSTNVNDLIISSANDSQTNFTQSPAVTTGLKQMVYVSESSDNRVALAARNLATGPNAHTGLTLFTSLGGGNMFSRYYELGCCIWLNGYQRSSNTFRWNYDIGGGDNLDIDANTKMVLDTSGKLTVDSLSLNNDNTVISSTNDSLTRIDQTPAVTTGDKFLLYESNTSACVQLEAANIDATTGCAIIRARTAVGSTGNPITSYFRNGVAQWVTGHQASTSSFRWNYDTSGGDILNTDANTKMKLETNGDLTLAGQLYQQADGVTLSRTLQTTFVIDASSTRYTWTSTRGALAITNFGKGNWAVNAATGISQLGNYDDAVGTYYCVVNFSCSIKTSVGTDQEIKIICQGAGTTNGFVPVADFGTATQVITTDWHNVSFNSLCIVGNTGWFEFAFANITSSNNIEIKDARATMYK